MKVTAIILTHDEEKHIERAINSIRSFVDQIVVVDSGSTDRTVEIASALGAHVLFHPWINYATQFNWAIGNLPHPTEWVVRLDADEIVTSALAAEIVKELPTLDAATNGVFVSRRMRFQGGEINHGGVSPIRVLRIFRHGHGQCEDRWMDEHIKVAGSTKDFAGAIIDDNLNSLTWWTEKHNKYSSREVVDLLNLEYRFIPHDSVAKLWGGRQSEVKRWLKEKIYSQLPGGLRALAYFFYRYFLCCGFLDGKNGLIFHFLQGFWYRCLVDAKLEEVRRHMRNHQSDARRAIEQVLGIRI
jgi:glycosyltransferase involved in cell wall biosynthesis